MDVSEIKIENLSRISFNTPSTCYFPLKAKQTAGNDNQVSTNDSLNSKPEKQQSQKDNLNHRDVDFLKINFFMENGRQTNDICELFEFWKYKYQSNHLTMPADTQQTKNRESKQQARDIIDISSSSLANQQSCFSVSNSASHNISKIVRQNSGTFICDNNSINLQVFDPIHQKQTLCFIDINDQTDQANEFSFETQQFNVQPTSLIQIQDQSANNNNNLSLSPNKNQFTTNQLKSFDDNDNNFISPIQGKSSASIANISDFNTNKLLLMPQDNNINILDLSPIGSATINNQNCTLSPQNQTLQPLSKSSWHKVQKSQLVKNSNKQANVFTQQQVPIKNDINLPLTVILDSQIKQQQQYQSSLIDVLSALNQTENNQQNRTAASCQPMKNISNDTNKQNNPSLKRQKSQVEKRSKKKSKNGAYNKDMSSHKKLIIKKSKQKNQEMNLILQTTQDIEKLQNDLLDQENLRNEEFNRNEESFEQKKIRYYSNKRILHNSNDKQEQGSKLNTQLFIEEQKLNTDRPILHFEGFNFKKIQTSKQEQAIQHLKDLSNSKSLQNDDNQFSNTKSNIVLKQQSITKLNNINSHFNTKLSSQKIQLQKIKGKKLSFNSMNNQNNNQISQSADREMLANNYHKSSTANQKVQLRNNLLELLINEFERKKQLSISTFENDQKVSALIRFWEESLEQRKILKKLVFKETKTQQKLSDKEQKLKHFLQGTNQDLLQLQPDSTTRKYGELAILSKSELQSLLETYLKV